MYLYEEPLSKPECLECMEKSNRLDDIKYWFRPILDQLYGLEIFDLANLEMYLEELAFCLGMQIPNQLLAIGTNHSPEVEKAPIITLDEWKEFNHQYLKNLAKTGT